MDWKELKEKVLFSYLGADWISIDVLDSTYSEIKDTILSISEFELKLNENGVLTLDIENVIFCFYNNDNHHFDFNPKEIDNENKWKVVLSFFSTLSKQLGKSIVFRPEDSNKGETENYLIKVTPEGQIEYFENVIKGYTDSEIENK